MNCQENLKIKEMSLSLTNCKFLGIPYPYKTVEIFVFLLLHQEYLSNYMAALDQDRIQEFLKLIFLSLYLTPFVSLLLQKKTEGSFERRHSTNNFCFFLFFLLNYFFRLFYTFYVSLYYFYFIQKFLYISHFFVLFQKFS